MRFYLMCFYPAKHVLKISVAQKAVEKSGRTDRFLPLVSNRDEGTLPIDSDARIYSGFLHAGKTEHYDYKTGARYIFTCWREVRSPSTANGFRRWTLQ
jgi:hypothetical protein